MNNEIKIKEIETSRYRISLYQVHKSYYIEYTNTKLETNNISEAIFDYNTASHLFELKSMELEGN